MELFSLLLSKKLFNQDPVTPEEVQIIIPETKVELDTAPSEFPEGWVMCATPVSLSETPNLVEGQTYKITITNTVSNTVYNYDMVAVYLAEMDMWLGGNIDLVFYGEDNGETYFFQIAKLQDGSGLSALNLATIGESGAYTVKLEY